MNGKRGCVAADLAEAALHARNVRHVALRGAEGRECIQHLLRQHLLLFHVLHVHGRRSSGDRNRFFE